MTRQHGVITQRHRPALAKIIAECVEETLSDARLDTVAGANPPFTARSRPGYQDIAPPGRSGPRDTAIGLPGTRRRR